MYNTDESFFTLPYKLCSPYLTAIGGYVTGYASTEYISEETPMAAYANIHLALEAMRVKTLLHAQIRASPETATPEDLKEEAENGPSDAPRVLILGARSRRPLPHHLLTFLSSLRPGNAQYQRSGIRMHGLRR